MLEKHLTLDCKRPGPDHAASLEPQQFADLVAAVRSIEIILGDGRKVPQAAEVKNTAIARKALVAAHPIAEGEIITEQNLAVKRPGCGLPPIRYWDVLGQSARHAYQTDDLIEL